jgi:hypothetical protein
MRGKSPNAAQLEQLFNVACRKAGLNRVRPVLSAGHFRPPQYDQLRLFS